METTQTDKEKQDSSPLDIRLKFTRMKQDGFRFLDQEYLAKKLNMSQGMISFAFAGKAPLLLKRISRHLDYLQNKKQVA